MSEVKKRGRPKGSKVKEKEEKPRLVMNKALTEEEIVKALPKGFGKRLSKELIAKIQTMGDAVGVDNSSMWTSFRESVHIMKEHRSTVKAYIDAVKFAAAAMYMNKTEAWKVVFPERYKRVTALIEKKKEEGVTPLPTYKNYANAYASGDLVKAVMMRAMVPIYLDYANVQHEQVNNLRNLSFGISKNGAKVPGMAQVTAAIKLIELTKVPEELRITHTHELGEEAKSVSALLQEQLSKNADMQLAQLQSGMSIEEVQKLGVDVSVTTGEEIIDAEEA